MLFPLCLLHTEVHPFRKYFEELNVGDTLITEKHHVTLQDIEDFADLSGDKFYAHMDAANVDLKGFTARFYRELCGADLEHVKETLVYLKLVKQQYNWGTR